MKVKWIAAAVVLVLLGLFLGRQLAPAGGAASPEVPLPTEVDAAIEPDVVDLSSAYLPECEIEILSPVDGSTLDGYGPLKLEWSSKPPGSDYWVFYDGPDHYQVGGGKYGTYLSYNTHNWQTTETSETLYAESLWPGEHEVAVQMQDANGHWCTAKVHFTTTDDSGLERKKERQDECNPAVERCG